MSIIHVTGQENSEKWVWNVTRKRTKSLSAR